MPQWAQWDEPGDDAGEAAPPSRTREPGGRALRAAARRRRRWYYLGGGAVVVVGAVLAVVLLTGGRPGPASVTPGALITTFQPGELRQVPNATFLLMNPENTYHWLSLKTVVRREVSEDDPAEGQRVTDQLDRIWVKYTGNEPPYALRDPSMDERRVLFELEVVRVATFGRP